MRKKELGIRFRRTTIGVLVILLAASLGGLAWSWLWPAGAEEEFTAYAYTQEADIGYQVHLRPNEVLTGTVQEAGRAYITELTSHVSTAFDYRFSGEEAADVKAEYGVTAALTAYTGSGEERRPVWDRNFVLQPPKSFSARDRELAIREAVKIPLADYAAYAARVAEATRFQPSELNLTVLYNVALEADTGAGMVREQFAPTLVIPLGGRTFTVGGDLSPREEGGLTATRAAAVPWVEGMRAGLTVAGGVFTVLLVVLLFGTRSVTVRSGPLQTELHRFLKDHSDRIVTGAGFPPGLGKAVTVQSFEDLIRAADELEKPILYLPGDGKEHSFYILAGEYVYRYTVRPDTPDFTRRKLAARVHGETVD